VRVEAVIVAAEFDAVTITGEVVAVMDGFEEGYSTSSMESAYVTCGINSLQL